MNNLPRLAALGAAAAVCLALTGCAGTTEPPSADPASTGTGATANDVYGPACPQVPTDGGSSTAGTAVGDNPLLRTFTELVGAAGLVDTLDDPEAGYTVFAPANAAFESLPAGTLDELLADPDGQLTDILAYHVVPERHDAATLAEQGAVDTLAGAEVVISGDADRLVIGESARAGVLCGDIPTANATVFVVDTVLMPPEI